MQNRLKIKLRTNYNLKNHTDTHRYTHTYTYAHIQRREERRVWGVKVREKSIPEYRTEREREFEIIHTYAERERV